MKKVFKNLHELLYNIKHINILKADTKIAQKNVDFWNSMYRKENEKRCKLQYEKDELQKDLDFTYSLLKLICKKYSIFRVYIDRSSLLEAEKEMDLEIEIGDKYNTLYIKRIEKKEEEKND